MATNTRSANARTMPTRRDAIGALFTTGTAAAATVGLIGLTVQPAKPDHIGDLLTANPDAHILSLGDGFDALCAELDALPLDADDEDDLVAAACDAAYDIADASAVTLAGIKVKIRAALWLTNWEAPVNPHEPNGADEEIALQVFRFVRAMEG